MSSFEEKFIKLMDKEIIYRDERGYYISKKFNQAMAVALPLVMKKSIMSEKEACELTRQAMIMAIMTFFPEGIGKDDIIPYCQIIEGVKGSIEEHFKLDVSTKGRG